MLFKLAAYGEAVGWTILITGIIMAHFLHSSLPVLIAGQFHGVLFLIYFAVTAVAAPSIRWGGKNTLLAIACGIPPYGSLAFELWQSNKMFHRKLSFTLYNHYLSQISLSDSQD